MFEFSGHGTRDGVIKAIQAKQLPENKEPSQAKRFEAAAVQAEIFKKFVIAEINSLPTDLNGCQVTANASFNPGSRTASVTIVGQKLHV